MKTILAAFIFSLSGAMALSLGDKIPENQTKMVNVDGRELAIDSVKGKNGTLVMFTCNHCPFVKAWLDRMVTIGNDYSKKNVGVIAINSNDPKEAPEDGLEQMKALASGKMNFAYVVDATSQVAKAFGAAKTPEFYLFDAKGKLVYQGALDSDSRNPSAAKPYLKTALDELLAGKKISTAETKALGCSIKFRTKS